MAQRHLAAADAHAAQGVKQSTPLIQPILVDVNRAALEIAYRQKFPKVPVFFERLLRAYEAGRLPCGWNGSMIDWPVGNIVVF